MIFCIVYGMIPSNMTGDKTSEVQEEENMKKIKDLLDRIFIDGLSGMAQGLFATLISGTIIQQIGTLVGGSDWCGNWCWRSC